MEVGTIDFAVYEGNDEFIGMAKLTLPDKTQKVISMEGAGIGGTVEVPVAGHYDAMTLGTEFRSYSERVSRLREPRRHTIECRIAQQEEDPVAGQLVGVPVKHVFVVVPKTQSGGEVAPASPSNTSLTFSVRYWATYINGEKVDEVDQLNRINVINGVDYNEGVRAALGK